MKKTRLIPNLLKSFKDFSYKSLIIIAIDTLFFLFAAFIIKRWAEYVQNVISSVPLPEQLQAMSLEKAQEVMTPDPRLLLIFSFVLIAAILIITFAITRSAVWMLSEKRHGKRKLEIMQFARFSLISLCWYLIVLIPSLAIFMMMKQEINLVFLAVIVPVFMHYSLSMHLSLAKSQKFSVIITALKTGTKNIHIFLLCYLLFLTGAYIIQQLWWLYRYLIPSYTIPRIILTSVVMCWIRYVMLRIVR